MPRTASTATRGTRRWIVFLEGALTEEQRAKLIEIAERCPVHQTLKGKIQVNTRFG
jgi:putative redox protein